MKKITVGIPCYNQSQYLPDAIESVLSQTVDPHEIIVCNDGSPDDTRYVANQYDGIKYIEQVNKGLASARNSIILNMTGDYFLPLDADDMMLENCVEKISEEIEETDADVVAPSFRCFGTHSEEVILMPNPKLQDFEFGNRLGYFSAIRRDVLLEIGGYSPRMVFGYEDLHMWINILSKGKKIVTIQEVLMLYRTKKESMITEAQKHHSELIAQIKKDFPNFNPKF